MINKIAITVFVVTLSPTLGCMPAEKSNDEMSSMLITVDAGGVEGQEGDKDVAICDCVPSEPPIAARVDDSSGYVWMQSSAPIPMKLQEAMDYCWNFSTPNYPRWKLPSIDEAKTLLHDVPYFSQQCAVTNNCATLGSCWTDYCESNKRIDSMHHGLANGQSLWPEWTQGWIGDYWTTTLVVPHLNQAVTVNYYLGNLSVQDGETQHFVRCIAITD